MMPLRQNLLMLVACLVALPAAALELKIATVAPDGSAWMRAMRDGAQRVEAATQGRVEFKFYPGGVMGDDSQILRRIRVGQLHGGAFTAGGLGNRYPALQAYGVPLLFRSLDEVDYVREHLDAELRAGLEEAGFVSFGFVEGGFAQFMSAEPVRSVDDLKRRKVWIPDGDQISLLALESLGVSPVPLPVTDVMTSLQTGLLDVVASSPVVALVLQWHTKVRYVTDLPVAYSFGIFAIDARSFGRIAEPDRQVVRDIMTEVVASLDAASREDNERALQAMLDIGIETVSVDTANLDGWRAAIESLFPDLRTREQYIDAAVFDRLLALLAQYRSETAVAGTAR
ncbi:MAG TPA: TRAP transporter substrate-binding protein DctP [Gammaproteobacteria bacterium]|nr:TRAP transporter substrate-binding protein DctP [Gammaproteobacteria bacterium]